jgi:hypothetical protein
MENIGMSVVAITYIETGKRWARLGALNKIANSLKVGVADWFKGIQTRKTPVNASPKIRHLHSGVLICRNQAGPAPVCDDTI